jgi:hypothetical protein
LLFGDRQPLLLPQALRYVPSEDEGADPKAIGVEQRTEPQFIGAAPARLVAPPAGLDEALAGECPSPQEASRFLLLR